VGKSNLTLGEPRIDKPWPHTRGAKADTTLITQTPRSGLIRTERGFVCGSSGRAASPVLGFRSVITTVSTYLASWADAEVVSSNQTPCFRCTLVCARFPILGRVSCLIGPPGRTATMQCICHAMPWPPPCQRQLVYLLLSPCACLGFDQTVGLIADSEPSMPCAAGGECAGPLRQMSHPKTRRAGATDRGHYTGESRPDD
jgi:hypothetical protein